MIANNDDYNDFWNECKLVQETKNSVPEDDDAIKLEIDEVENNAELLRAMGMGHLVDVFNQCREINDTELDISTRQLSKRQADTVRKRVKALNQTVRSRIPGRQQRGWQRKPDIRNVFRDVETSSTGTRSRSATPDSLDSVGKLVDVENCQDSPPNSPWVSPSWTSNESPAKSLVGSVPSFVKIFHQPDSSDGQTISSTYIRHSDEKDTLRRTPSAPPSCTRGILPLEEDATNNLPQVLSSNEMFGRLNWTHYRGNVASNSEGIELVGFSRIGTIVCSRNSRDRTRINRDAIEIPAEKEYVHPEILSRSNEPISFEMAFSQNMNVNIPAKSVQIDSNCVEIDEKIPVELVTDLNFKELAPILWMEICMLFDKYSLKIHRRQAAKRKRKEVGNLFGVNLSTLVMRDYRLKNDTSTMPVPSVIRDILSRLSGSRLREEGILRIAGNKHRVENLCVELEENYYKSPDEMRALLDKSTSHELIAVLKKLIRELPQPLFTFELLHLFYEVHAMTDEHDQLYALHLLVLLLPVENRTTLYSLLQFLNDIVRNQEHNKMSVHNVAMIIAPSLFPPSRDLIKKNIGSEITYAAVCCKLTEKLITNIEELQTVPASLLNQARALAVETPHSYKHSKKMMDKKQMKQFQAKKILLANNMKDEKN